MGRRLSQRLRPVRRRRLGPLSGAERGERVAAAVQLGRGREAADEELSASVGGFRGGGAGARGAVSGSASASMTDTSASMTIQCGGLYHLYL